MPRLRILQVPNFNVAVQRGPVSGFGSVALSPLAVPPPSAKQTCTGGDYDCPEGWAEAFPMSSPACPPGLPCPAPPKMCQPAMGGAGRGPGMLPVKEAILAAQPPLPPGTSVASILAKYAKTPETCTWTCPAGTVLESSGSLVPGAPPMCSPRAPLTPPGPPAPWYNEAILGVPLKAWAIGVAGVGLAFAAGIAAMMWSRRSAVPNSAELAAEYLPRSPEAALMLMPPAIPSYLAYRYALKRMHPEDAEFVEQWRDYVPSDEPEWDPDWEWEEYDA